MTAGPFVPAEQVAYQSQAIVSKQVIKQTSGNVTLFAFDEGENLSEHTAPFDALIQIIEGHAEVTIAGNPFQVTAGNMIILPANIPHAVKAIERFKMMLVMIKG